MRQRIRQRNEALVTGRQRGLRATTADLDLCHGQIRLQDEAIGAAVHDAGLVVEHLEPGDGEAVVEARPEFDADPDRAAFAAHEAQELGVAPLVVVFAHCEAVDEHQRSMFGLEAGLEHIGRRSVRARVTV